MEEVHRQLLHKNRTRLMDNIANPIDVVDKLIEKLLFTEPMGEEVGAEKTQRDRVRKILDILQKRGPNAFNIFYECLLETSNDTAAELLHLELSKTHPDHNGDRGTGDVTTNLEIELPQDWPNERIMTAPLLSVQICSMQSVLVKEKWNNQHVYSMKKRCRGRCLVISNKIFHGPLERDNNGVEKCMLSDREGTERDVEKLLVLFHELYFDVCLLTELNIDGFRRELSKEANNPAHQDAECFVCVILSHGNHLGIYGVDGNVISLEEVQTYFDRNNCIALRGKPKLFFIQACQGETVDRPVDAAASGVQELSDSVAGVNVTGDRVDQPNPGDDPTKADILVASATPPGYLSFRNLNYGSWFIQAVVYVFRMYANKEDIFTLLTLVNRLVANGRTRCGQTDHRRNAMQVSRYTTTLLKQFYFFPGLCEEKQR